jgi:hypothetical protein
MENEEIKIYENTIREDILKHIDDLREKISNNVYFSIRKTRYTIIDSY